MIKIKETKREFLLFLLGRPVKKVLDLGCGKGLMSKFFSKKSKVISIDKKNNLFETTPNFEFIEEDIRNIEFGKDNDLIIASLILHFFDKKESVNIIKRMKNATSNLGYNFLICMSNKDNLSNQNPNNFYPSLEELKKIYSGWKIIKQLQGFTEYEVHRNSDPHKHNLIFIIFQNA